MTAWTTTTADVIRRIDEEAIHRQLDSGAIVLIGPVAVSVTGESFNLTSEEVATQLASKLKAEKMIGFLFFARGDRCRGRNHLRAVPQRCAETP
ncbi:Amino-acid acetyltransferase [Serratia rubidaea]|uniref:Amino-acid acetyltransferase n=1 Tax=Serratia rubidaea TaxID=61652 RepID=A0A4U9HPX3_SERRU|nr:Amino-acid acetyltransferase [Serratia rubidaea]